MIGIKTGIFSSIHLVKLYPYSFVHTHCKLNCIRDLPNVLKIIFLGSRIHDRKTT